MKRSGFTPVPAGFLLCVESLPEPEQVQVPLTRFYKRVKKEQQEHEDVLQQVKRENQEFVEMVINEIKESRKRIRPDYLLDGHGLLYPDWYKLNPLIPRPNPLFDPTKLSEEEQLSVKLCSLEGRFVEDHWIRHANTLSIIKQREALCKHINKDGAVQEDVFIFEPVLSTPSPSEFLSQDVRLLSFSQDDSVH